MTRLPMALAAALALAAPAAAQTAPLSLDIAARAVAASGQVVVFGTDRSVPAGPAIARFNADADGQDGRVAGPGSPVAGTPTHGAAIFARLRAEDDGR